MCTHAVYQVDLYKEDLKRKIKQLAQLINNFLLFLAMK